jgi:hypothetical protein
LPLLLARLEITITLALKLEGIVLKVRGGKIREICFMPLMHGTQGPTLFLR